MRISWNPLFIPFCYTDQTEHNVIFCFFEYFFLDENFVLEGFTYNKAASSMTL